MIRCINCVEDFEPTFPLEYPTTCTNCGYSFTHVETKTIVFTKDQIETIKEMLDEWGDQYGDLSFLPKKYQIILKKFND